jgi:antitoxin component YwqK of YwqJK toxin-antitoxin module
VILTSFTACKKKNPKPVFDLNSPGGEVIAMYTDSIPQVVFYYKLDEKGKHTQEKIGEAYYYENQQQYVGGGFKDGKREGKWYAFFRDGSVQTEAFYIDGKEHGAYNVYRENGNPYYKGHYDHGNCDGTWTWYDEEGNITKKIKADKNTAACEYCEKCQQIRNKR